MSNLQTYLKDIIIVEHLLGNQLYAKATSRQCMERASSSKCLLAATFSSLLPFFSHQVPWILSKFSTKVVFNSKCSSFCMIDQIRYIAKITKMPLHRLNFRKYLYCLHCLHCLNCLNYLWLWNVSFICVICNIKVMSFLVMVMTMKRWGWQKVARWHS